MNTDRLSGELFHDLMHLLDIVVLPDREDVAVGYLNDGQLLDLTPTMDQDGNYCVTTTLDGTFAGLCTFATEAEALKFIDALAFLASADDLAVFNL
jgi:hypothetical protein